MEENYIFTDAFFDKEIQQDMFKDSKPKMINIKNPVLHTLKGQNEIKLISKIADGEHGTVYQTDNPDFFAYIFYKIDSLLERKLKAMIETYVPNTADWPVDLLLDDDSIIVGHLIKPIQGCLLYSFVSNRNNIFNLAKVDLLDIIISFCKSVKELHERNIVIGDLKPYNTILTNNKEVVFCDSIYMQIGEFPCVYFTESFMDPHFYNISPRERYRGKEWDRFVLFLNIHFLLFRGSNAYSIRMQDKEAGVYPFYLDEEKTKEQAPIGSSEIWSHLPTYIKKALIDAGDKNRGTRYEIGSRYTPEEWIALFERYRDDILSGKLNADPKCTLAYPIKDAVDYKLVDIE